MQTTSVKQISSIVKEEQFSATAYPDGQTNGVQNYSIGYGHQIRPNEQSLKRGSVTREWGAKQLAIDLKPVESLINSTSRHTLTQAQFDELADFGYNAGTGAMLKVLATWNITKDGKQVAEHISQYVYTHLRNGNLSKVNALVTRRAAESAPFLTGAAVPAVGICAVAAVCALLF